MDEKKETKLIFSQRVAKKLIEMGCTVTGITSNHDNHAKTVFAFKNDDRLAASLDEAMKSEDPEVPSFRVVSSAKIAKKLIEGGTELKDIRPDRNNAERTVFLFERVPGLEEKINEIAEAYKEAEARDPKDEKALKTA